MRSSALWMRFVVLGPDRAHAGFTFRDAAGAIRGSANAFHESANAIHASAYAIRTAEIASANIVQPDAASTVTA
jgi:hypothetical protein